MCGVFMAAVLAGCGTAEEEIQKVEQESMAEEFPPEEDTAPEKEEETDRAPEREDQQGESGTEKRPESETPEAEPALVTIEREEKEYKEGEILVMSAAYDRVSVTVEGNEAATQAIMAEFERREQSFRENLADTIEWAKQDTLVTDSGMSYSEESGYGTERNDGRVLSFSVGTSGFEGGAHGYYMNYGLNFDAETGQVLAIEDIAQDMAAFQEICVQEMLRQCEDLRAQGLLFDEDILEGVGGLQEILAGKMEGEEWYFTEDGVRFISNIYEIAPYAAGNFQFDIPYEKINETLKEKYRG